ncbi:MAG TPA: HD domain-containing phosphohydrolase [Gemmatimonadales bacterium]|jgi:putative nucleotidyltransferase with HDIG domain|nr:HD domain-containing phosphohydrolase [Gemmatimonadales bacterium]
MSEPVRFLTALSHALSTLGLYGEGHPAVRRAADAAYRQLSDVQQGRPSLVFTFLPEEVLFGRDLLPELERWEWSARFAQGGIERLEITGPVSEPQFERFLGHAAAVLGLAGDPRGDLWQDGPEGIRFGRIRIDDTGCPAASSEPLPVATLAYSLREERDAVGWVHQEVGAGKPIPMLEAYGVVRSLSMAMHGGQAMVMPLLQLKEFDQYTTTHSMNVSVLTMALGEFLGLAPPAVRAFGLAGLLHDLGKVRIPREILSKPGKLTAEERAVVEAHPADGARMILEGSEPLDLAAVVAYEHHRGHDGSGYPRAHYEREVHQASRLVHVCDVYDALRTRRPYRDAWTSAEALEYLGKRSGTEFDPAMSSAFIEMMQRWDDRITLEEIA